MPPICAPDHWPLTSLVEARGGGGRLGDQRPNIPCARRRAEMVDRNALNLRWTFGFNLDYGSGTLVDLTSEGRQVRRRGRALLGADAAPLC